MDARKVLKTCLMLVVVFLVYFIDIEFFVFSKKLLIFYINFFGVFLFGSIGVQLRVVGLVDALNFMKACLFVVVVFFVCFSVIEFFVFPVFFLFSSFHHNDLVACNGTQWCCGSVDAQKILKAC